MGSTFSARNWGMILAHFQEETLGKNITRNLLGSENARVEIDWKAVLEDATTTEKGENVATIIKQNVTKLAEQR